MTRLSYNGKPACGYEIKLMVYSHPPRMVGTLPCRCAAIRDGLCATHQPQEMEACRLRADIAAAARAMIKAQGR